MPLQVLYNVEVTAPQPLHIITHVSCCNRMAVLKKSEIIKQAASWCPCPEFVGLQLPATHFSTASGQVHGSCGPATSGIYPWAIQLALCALTITFSSIAVYSKGIHT